MTFLNVLRAARASSWPETRITREEDDSPSFVLDELGQLRIERDCLYLGDILDMEDWHIESV